MPVNWNQLDPKYLALGSAALNAAAAEPVPRQPERAGSRCPRRRRSRAQLLQPFPQFSNVYARQVTEGQNQYNAGIVEWTRRLSHGWGGRVSYTYSVLKDNQIGETNFYSNVGTNPLNNYNYNPSAPACTAGQQYTTACYDPRADWGYGILDVPHRIIIAPMVELPFGKGKQFANSGGLADVILGGWSVVVDHHLAGRLPDERPAEQSRTRSWAAAPAPGRTSRPASTSRPRAATRIGWRRRIIRRRPGSTRPRSRWRRRAPSATRRGRSPISGRRPQFNTDLSVIKNFGLGGSKQAQVRLEVLNLFNRPTVRALSGGNTFAPGNSFGTTTSQSGFMRIMQFMFRFSF